MQGRLSLAGRLNDEWLTTSRYMMVEACAIIDNEATDPILGIAAKAA